MKTKVKDLLRTHNNIVIVGSCFTYHINKKTKDRYSTLLKELLEMEVISQSKGKYELYINI